jgi:preprotein translocase subunit SecG
MRIFLSILLIILILPQTEFDNLLLRKFLDTGYFTGYPEAKMVLNLLTWLSIYLFFFLNVFFTYYY